MPLSSKNNTAMDVKKPIKHSKHQSVSMTLNGVRPNSTSTAAAATEVLIHLNLNHDEYLEKGLIRTCIRTEVQQTREKNVPGRGILRRFA
jgi:hypothetical protein